MTDSYFITFEDSDENIAMRYADDVLRYQTQLPLALSWSTYSGVADPGFLFSDDEEQSILYPAGTNRTAIQIQTKDRYSGITITVLSGAPSVYVQVSEYFADLNPAFIAAPYTVSGDSGLNDLYLATYTEDTPEFPEDYWIPLPGEGSYKIVFPSPVVGNAITVTHSGSSPYKISQILPRKSVQAYDLEVNSIKAYHVSSTLIDTIALQVADSIVVGPDLIGAKSIDGSKIIDGTISGVLIRDGTVTGNKVLAGTISGVLITAGSITSNQIAVSGITAINLAANSITADNINVRTITADKIVLNGITSDEMAAAAVTSTVLANNAVVSGKVAANAIYGESIVGGVITGYHVAANTITAGNITAGTITANEIAVSGITANRLSVNQLDAVAANMGTLTVNSGISVGTNGYITVPSGYISAGKAKLDSTGLRIGDVASSNLPSITDTLRIAGSGGAGNIVGMALYNGAFHATTPQALMQLDGTNALEIENNASSNALINFNFPTNGLATSAAVNIYNGNLFLRKSPDDPTDIAPGTIFGTDSYNNTVRYKLGPDQLLLNNNTADTFTVNASNGNIATVGNIEVFGNIHAGTGDHMFTVNGTTGNLHVGAPPHVFRVNGTSGNTHIEGTAEIAGTLSAYGDVGFGTYLDKFTVASATGNTVIAGTLTAAGDVIFGEYGDKLTVQSTTGNTAIAGTLGVTGQTTLGALNATGAIGFGTSSNKFTVAAATGNTAIAGTLGVTNKITSTYMGYLTVRRTADVAITTAGTTITWQSVTRSNNITVATDTITIENAGYYMFSATFATVANLTSLRMTLQRGGINYVSTLHGAGLGTGVGYIFNFSVGFWATANSTYKVTLTPSANTTLVASAEGTAGPSPIMNIFQAIGV